MLKPTTKSLIDGDGGWVDRFLEIAAAGASADARTSLEVAIRIGRLISRIQSEKPMSKSAISPSDFDTLAAIISQGAPYRARPSDLATWAGVTNGTMTTRIDRLERLGLVSRQMDDGDRRIRWICLSRKGLERIQSQAKDIAETSFFSAIGTLSDEERQLLAATLSKLCRF